MGFAFLDYLKCDPEDINFRILVLSGFWPLDTNKKWLYIIFSIYSYLCTFSLVSMMFIQILDIYLLRNDPLTLVKNLSSTGMTLMCVIKHLYFLFKAKEVNNLRESIKSFKKSRHEAEDVELLQKANKQILHTTKIFYSLAILCVVIWMVFPAFDSTEYRRLPFPYRLPVDLKETPTYEINYAYHCLSMIGYMTNIVSFDLVFFGFVLQINSIYDVLINDFKNIQKIYEYYLHDNNNKNKIDKETENMIQEIIKRNCILQKKIFRKIWQLRKIFSIPGLLTYMSLVNQMGTIVFEVFLYNQGFGLKLMHRMLYVMCGIIDGFLWSYGGTILNEKGIEITNAAYDLPWYEMSPQTKKKIQTIIINSRRSPVLSLGAIIPLNLSAFLKLLKTSYNITALLRETIKK